MISRTFAAATLGERNVKLLELLLAKKWDVNCN